jgi:hypothetical protein
MARVNISELQPINETQELTNEDLVSVVGGILGPGGLSIPGLGGVTGGLPIPDLAGVTGGLPIPGLAELTGGLPIPGLAGVTGGLPIPLPR